MSVNGLTKLFARLLAVLVASASLTLMAQPAHASPPQVTIDHINYELDGDPFYRATIVGEDGSLGDTLAPPSSITYNGQVYSVTEIGYAAFEDSPSLRHVMLPSSMLHIAPAAFRQNNPSPTVGITDVLLNNGLLDIGASAFVDTRLTELVMPDSISTLGFCVACQIETLTTLRLSQSLTSIPDSAFQYDESLTAVEIPGLVASIGTAAFYRAPLVSLDIPGNVASIGWMAFNSSGGDITFQGAPPTLLPSASGTFLNSARMIFTCPYASSITAGQWEGYDAIAQCTVSYHATGGSMMPYGITEYGGLFTRPVDPVRDGYTFAGWYTTNSFTTPFDFSQVVTSDQQAYAKWEVATTPLLASTGANGGALALMATAGVLLFLVGLAGVVLARRRSKAIE